jgi:Trypsin
MKQIILLLIFIPLFSIAQFGDKSKKPIGWERNSVVNTLPAIEITADPITIEKLEHQEHASYLCATAIETEIKFSDFQLAEIMSNGDKIYRLAIHSEGAKGMMLNFENFVIQQGAKLWLYDVNKVNFIGEYAARDNYTADKSFMTSHVRGSTIIIEYLEPKNLVTPEFTISKIYHYFRGLKSADGTGFGASGSCMLNANCSEGNSREDANAATCKIKVTTSSSSGFCTGTMLNNTSEDMTPYIITANHCSANSSLADLVNWEFYFLYQSNGCSNPFSEPLSLDFKGCTAPAYSGSDNGENSSDFLFLKLKSTLPINLYDFTFLGWDRANANFSNNICFHHPAGDIKKVSKTNGFTSMTPYGPTNTVNTHLQVQWASTANGHSVTEGGSSGSGLINSNGHLIGTLTGGGSLCTARNQPDFYGRFYMHWDKYGTAVDQRVKPWLDPTNSGVTSLRSIKSSGATAGITINESNLDVNILSQNQSIILNSAKQINSIKLYNSIGQLMSNQYTKSNQIELNMAMNPRGIYIIEMQIGESKLVKKIAW